MVSTLLIGGIGMQEILLIALVILLFFGGKKIPELMKGLGKGVRSFKDGMNTPDKDDTDDKTAITTADKAEQKDAEEKK